jgi:CBS domain-containing membrane protein
LRSITGALAGLLLVVVAAKFLGKFSGVNEWLRASLVATALIVIALPQSPMAQTSAVIAENTLSALIGMSNIDITVKSFLAIPVAASPSILGMFMLRCLHLPAATVVLITVLSHVG